MTLERKYMTDTMSPDMETTVCDVCGLRMLSEEDSMTLLRKHILKIKGKRSRDLLRVVEELQCLQLGLDLAIFWLNQREHQNSLLGEHYKLSLFNDMFRARTDLIKTRDSYRNLRDQHERIIYSTYEVVREQLHSRHRGARVGEALDHMAHISHDLMDRWDTQEFHRDMDEDILGLALVALHDYCVVTLHHGTIYIHPTIQKIVRYKIRDEGDDELNILDHNLTYHKDIKVDHRIALWGYALRYKEVLRKHSDVPGVVMHLLIKDNRLGDALLFAEQSVKVLRALPDPPVKGIRAVLLQFGDLFNRITEAPSKYDKKLRRVEKLDLPWMLDVMDPVTSNNYYCFWDNQCPENVDAEEVHCKLLLCSESLDVQIRTTPCTRDKVKSAMVLLEEALVAKILNEGEYDLLRGECEACYWLMCRDFAGALTSFQELMSKQRETENGWGPKSLRSKINVFYALKKLEKEGKASQVLSEITEEMKLLRCDTYGSDYIRLYKKLADLHLYLGSRTPALETYMEVMKYNAEVEERDKVVIEEIMKPENVLERLRHNVRPYPGYMNDPQYWERVLYAKIERSLRHRVRYKKKNKCKRKIMRRLDTRMDVAYLKLEFGMADEALSITKEVNEKRMSLINAYMRQPFEWKAMIGACTFVQGNVPEALAILESAHSDIPWKRKLPSRQYPLKPKEDVVREFLVQLAIAKCHSSLGDQAKAVGVLRDVYQGKIAMFGPDHPDVIATKNELDSCTSLLTEKEGESSCSEENEEVDQTE